ncbi:MAG: peptidylprolyl isomerase [Gammaproteobacteria bacterium]
MRHFLISAGFLLASIFSSNVSAVALTDGIEVDHIVAIVNDSLIARSELDREIDNILERFQQAGRPVPPRSAIESQVLDKLITERLQLDQAEKVGIDVTPDMMATMIGNIAKKNGLTLPELRESLQADGMSFKAFRNQLKKQIMLTRLKSQEIINKINVSEAEIDNLLKQDSQIGKKNSAFRIQHILIAVPEGSSPERLAQAKKRTIQLINELNNGADFTSLAIQYSNGRQALEGGDLGWLKSSELPSLFADIVLKMSKGEISNPIRSSSGFHIIKLADIKGGSNAFITQTKARHILINTSEMVSDEDARTRLEQLHFRLEGGDDFAKLARSHSDDKGSAIKGGELGWVEPGSVVKEFQDVMDKLEPGEISEPFRTQFGWHIVQVLDRRQHDNSEKILRSEAREIIVERKAKEATDLYLRRLRDEAYIEIRLDPQ